MEIKYLLLFFTTNAISFVLSTKVDESNEILRNTIEVPKFYEETTKYEECNTSPNYLESSTDFSSESNLQTASLNNLEINTTYAPKIEETTANQFYGHDLEVLPINYQITTEKETDEEINDNSSTVNSTETTETETTTIDPCRDAKVIVNYYTTPFWINLDWIVQPDDCQFNYSINFSDLLFSTNETNFNITQLNACENYTVSLSTFYQNNEIVHWKKVLTTDESLTDPTIKYTIEDSKLNLNWKVPENVKLCVNFYRLEIFQDEKNVINMDLLTESIVLNNIANCTNNTYFITAYSASKESAKAHETYDCLFLNSPPINGSLNQTEDTIMSVWNFGQDVCKPEAFYLKCIVGDNIEITVKGSITDQLTAEIKDPIPYQKYTCWGFVSNKKGNSSDSYKISYLTNPKPPDEVTNLEIDQNNDNLTISWTPPDNWNGEKELYNVTLEFIKLTYNLTANCSQPQIEPMSKVVNVSEQQTVFRFLNPASEYRVTVFAKSNGGFNNGTDRNHKTNEDIPEKPTITSYELIDRKDINYNVSLNISWTPPCNKNGILTSFSVSLTGYRLINKEDKYQETSAVNITEEDFYNFEFQNLKPEYNYSVKIEANVAKFKSDFAEAIFQTPAGIPESEEMFIIENSKVKENTYDIIISQNLFNQTMGEIVYYAIIVATEHCTERRKFEFYENEWPSVNSDNSSCVNKSRAYQATENYWNPFKLTRKFAKESFVLGQNTNCDKLDCNRPLLPNTKYFVKIRGFTRNAFSDTVYISFITDILKNEIPLGLIVGLIVGILALAFVIAVALFYVKGKLNFTNWPGIDSNSPISPAPLPVPLKKFSMHYSKMNENPGKIKNEFQLLSTISSDVTLSTKAALLPINKKKNRYINILPYDQTRVKLEESNATSSDYINASYIQGYTGNVEYIASQGPTESTCAAFWQMIMEQNVKLIVMLTQFIESGKEKCYKYFPDVKEEYEFVNDLKVVCVDEALMSVYNRRIFKLIKGNLTKKITHIQFNLWPDFGVPEEAHQVIEFCEMIKDYRMKNPGLAVVHCSAGVGRTGTLIAIDILIQSIKDKRKVDIFGTVLSLRKQRMSMVQSESQYEFLYKCVNYVVTQGNFLIKPNQINESNML